jgi:chromosome partitioning protein
MTQIITIANEKGGVAKTTSAVSLGGALVQRGQEVLLVDLDPQASMTLALGITPHKVRRTITDVLLNSATPLGASRETSIPGLDMIPANSSLSLAERFLPIRTNYKHILSKSLNQIQIYDTILIDCPPSLGAITQSAIVAADLLIIPTQAEYFSAYALRNMIETIESITKEDNPDLTFRILVTMFDRRLSSHKTLIKQLYSVFGEKLIKSVVQIDNKLRECAIVGLPVTHYMPKTRSAQQYRAMAKELALYG